jgi:hypothetical protein
MPKNDPAILKQVTVSLPFGIGSASWESDPTERNAAWELYVELVTRIAVQSLEPNMGLVREALNSMYSLFGSTREILRNAGPKVGASKNSVGGIAITVLNQGLRPFLSKWHPELQEWEAQKTIGISARSHEQDWVEKSAFCKELEALRKELAVYAQALAKIAGVGE